MWAKACVIATPGHTIQSTPAYTRCPLLFGNRKVCTEGGMDLALMYTLLDTHASYVQVLHPVNIVTGCELATFGIATLARTIR